MVKLGVRWVWSFIIKLVGFWMRGIGDAILHASTEVCSWFQDRVRVLGRIELGQPITHSRLGDSHPIRIIILFDAEQSIKAWNRVGLGLMLWALLNAC